MDQLNAKPKPSTVTSILVMASAIILVGPHAISFLLMIAVLKGWAEDIAIIALVGFFFTTLVACLLVYGQMRRAQNLRRALRRWRGLRRREVMPAGVICHRCSYDLRSLRTDSRCPECGEPIVKSLDTPEDGVRKPFWTRYLIAYLALAAIPLGLGLYPKITSPPSVVDFRFFCWRAQEELLWSAVVFIGTGLCAALASKWVRERRFTVRRGMYMVPALLGSVSGTVSCLIFYVRYLASGIVYESYVDIGVMLAGGGTGIGVLLLAFDKVATPNPKWPPAAGLAYLALFAATCVGVLAFVVTHMSWC
ncbi:MAG: hypothetical protein H6817_09190 [Phycisphaerales bacterium]|nr:hypothetical protein [Phycisphaerales bacterium]